jgi:hypothetical protein
MPKVIALTSSCSESGVKGLEPVGILMGYQYSSKGVNLGRADAIEKLKIEAEANGCTHVFNVQFESWTVGHPNNNDYGSRATGDGYRSAHRDKAPEPLVEYIPLGGMYCQMKCCLCGKIIGEGSAEELANLCTMETHMETAHPLHGKQGYFDGTQRS